MSGFLEATAFLYDPRGRCDRKGFLIILSITLSLQIALGLIIWTSGFSLAGPAMTIAKVAFVWIALSATSQRLHDLGLSGLWIVAATIGSSIWCVTGTALFFVLLTTGTIAPSDVNLLVYGTVLYLPVLVTVCWLHGAKGQGEENRFGSVPGPSGFSYQRAPVEMLGDNVPVPA